MLVWPIAPTAPSSIEAIDTKVTICRQSNVIPPNAPTATRSSRPIAAALGAPAKNAATGVGAPS